VADLGGINGHYLRDITENAARETEEVFAAVAYAGAVTAPGAMAVRSRTSPPSPHSLS